MSIDDVPLVGREGELAEVHAAITSDPPRSVIVAGPPGIGKSRLVGEVIDAVGARHLRTSQAASAHDFLALAPLLGGTTPTTALEALRIVIERSDGESVVAIDDLQWLDEPSAAVLHLAVSEGWLTVVGSLRSGTPAPAAVMSLWKDGLADRLDLGPLDRTAVDELAAGLAGAPLDGHAGLTLWNASKGNPLHAREWLRAALDGRLLEAANGMLVLTGEVHAPARLTELLRARVGGLEPELHRLVCMVAVADGLRYDDLAGLADAATVVTAERSDLVVIDETDRRVWLAHPLMTDAALATLTAGERIELARRVAAHVLDRDPAPHDHVRATLLLLRAGAPISDDDLLHAADIARREGDLAAFNALAAPAAERGSVDALLMLGELAARAVDPRAEQLLSEAIRLSTSATTTRVATRALAFHLAGTGRGAEAIELLERSWREAGLEPEEEAARRAMCAMVWLLAEGPSSALHQLGGWRPVEFTEWLNTRWTGALAFALLGRFDDVERAIAEFAEHLASGDGTARMPDGIRAYVAMAATDAGWHDRAASEARRSYEVAVGSGDREDQATAALMLGRLELVRGALSSADRWFRESGAASRAFGDELALRWALGGQLLVAAWRGDVETGRELLSDIDGLDAAPSLLDLELVERASAWHRYAEGHHSDARARLVAAADAARRCDQPVAELRLLHDLVRMTPVDRPSRSADVRRGISRIADLAALQHGRLPELIGRQAMALGELDVAALRTVGAEAAEMGLSLLGAESFAAAATIAERSGDRAAAFADRTRLDELASTLDGAATPLLRSPATANGLTPREHEIALLAGAGSSSKQIAEQLHLSPRTVDNCLARVFAKLGITSRRELASALSTSK